jgi:hypothetical protein
MLVPYNSSATTAEMLVSSYPNGKRVIQYPCEMVLAHGNAGDVQICDHVLSTNITRLAFLRGVLKTLTKDHGSAQIHFKLTCRSL